MTKIVQNQNFEKTIITNGNSPDLFFHQFAPEIIRKYDIRGIANKNLFDLDAYAIGRSFAQYLTANGGKTVIVGYDGRHSSNFLESALVKGLTEGGANVVRVGLGPTPLVYYSVQNLSADAGIMVTGSHNAAEYNGFKITLKNRPFFGKDLQQLSIDATRGLHRKNVGTASNIQTSDSYTKRLVKTYHGDKPLSVVWDPGNGAAGEIVQELVLRLPGNHCIINGDIDGNFPNHHPDPTVPDNLKQIRAKVRDGRYDLGIAFDGDGDRIGAIDETGKIIYAVKLLTLISIDILTRHPKSTFIADVKTSQTYFDKISELGGNAIMWNTGHSLIKSKMIETGALLAGEMSGHIFFADSYYGYDDALYAAVRLLSLISTSGSSLAELSDALPQAFSTPEIRIPCPEADKQSIMQAICEQVTTTDSQISKIDGIRVSSPTGWWLIRASNTEPALVARCEANSKNDLSVLTDKIRILLGNQGLQITSVFIE